jgi:large subunit ribosomal protein L25
MPDASKMKSEMRKPSGTRAARTLRREGRVPAILYGHKQEPVSVSLPAHDLQVALGHGAHLLELDIQGSPTRCLIKDVQYDHLDEDPIHVDLMRVSLDERVQVVVPIELRGVPAGVNEGGVLDQILGEVEVDCLVTEIPEVIRVRIASLGLNESLRVRDLDVPAGVRLLAEPEDPVCTVRPLGEEPEEEAPAEEGEAEPEVIRREQKEQPEEEGG